MIVIGYNGFTKSADYFGRLYQSTGIDRHIVMGHDAAVAVIVDDELVCAVEEERLNREKKTSAFPINAFRWALETSEIAFERVDKFAFPWSFSADVANEMIRDIVATDLGIEEKFEQLHKFGQLYSGLLVKDAIRADFENRTGCQIPDEKLMLVPHHFAHLMCGYYLSGWSDTAFLVSDGRAERHSSIMGEVRNGEIHVFEEGTIGANDSVALLFGAITRYLGFTPNNDEYKVMGLSAFAPPQARNPLLEHVVTLSEGGRYSLALANDLANDPRGIGAYYPLLDQIFGGREGEREELPFRAKVARAAQEMIEVVTVHQIHALEKRTNLPRLVFEGGLALNCVNNTRMLEESRFTDMKVSFGASDPGVAIGAAVYASHRLGRKYHRATSPYLGPAYDDEAIRITLADYTDRIEWTELDQDSVANETAKLLCRKVVVGWFQGCTEYGPRALGNRSILANPSFADIKDIINTKVKHREPFRPFAPVVLETEASRIFELGKKRSSPYMTFVFPVKQEYRRTIPGACHVDGTSRIQTITERDNAKLAALLQKFTELSGVPCLINTSFNIAGEPIVSSPDDALRCFLKTEIDYLVIGRFLIMKSAAEG